MRQLIQSESFIHVGHSLLFTKHKSPGREVRSTILHARYVDKHKIKIAEVRQSFHFKMNE